MRTWFFLALIVVGGISFFAMIFALLAGDFASALLFFLVSSALGIVTSRITALPREP